jgi:hypothetical protein
MQYRFQGEQQPDLRVPYPVIVTDDGAIVDGRPDAHALIGFQVGLSMKIRRTFEQLVEKEDVDWAVGKFPVYRSAFDDGRFVVLEKITEVVELEEKMLGMYR